VLIENGVLNGDFTEWHENGKIKTQGVYENNICNIEKEFD
jgi:antitoxin component YwqK of YwqJK toxin-antitoxin module